jgi:hypothetical protein
MNAKELRKASDIVFGEQKNKNTSLSASFEMNFVGPSDFESSV